LDKVNYDKQNIFAFNSYSGRKTTKINKKVIIRIRTNQAPHNGGRTLALLCELKEIQLQREV
jgi:hypothetical protein